MGFLKVYAVGITSMIAGASLVHEFYKPDLALNSSKRHMSESHLTFSVALHSLSEWVVERKVMPPRWRATHLALLQKSSVLAEKTQLKANDGHGTNYAFCCSCRDSLSETCGRSFIGGLAGYAKQWDLIVKAYEKENIQIGELILSATHESEFEIPSILSQLQKLQQQIANLEKQETDFIRSAAYAQQSYVEECKQVGIEGVDIEKEVQDLVNTLPDLFIPMLKLIVSMDMSNSLQEYLKHGKVEDFPVLSILCNCVVMKSNSSFKWLESDLYQLKTALLDNSCLCDSQSLSDVACIISGSCELQNELVIELGELQAFYKQAEHDELHAQAAMDLSSSNLAGDSKIEFKIHKKVITSILSMLNSKEMVNLINLKNSKHNMARTIKSLQRLAEQASKYYRLQREVEKKKVELKQQIDEDTEHMSALAEKISSKVNLIETLLSQHFNGQKFHITGSYRKQLKQ